ncbi:type IX secretion system outer membrane channel protein PorV [Aureitalea marina]|uniref:Type IX secretion system protein PorV domain-containing protein n=1 Tax=Aureitalea marina TaxID=930804 RepID=A0A2S7KQT6_9FLAO|nr:type IX secretion system outer membrane channel protein PorV [Aureitalea marina]PQB04986.1 hypothetical protein BST85_08830 [Aureitalea marina]
MKKIFIPILTLIMAFQAVAQDNGTSVDNRVITTGVPFVLIAADARSAGIADIGVTSSADAFSQQWNPAKYAFALDQQGIGITYTPYLSQLVNDIFLGNLVYYNRINERSAFALSFRYFSLGEIELRETIDQEPLLQSPNELTFDVSYSLRLSDQFSLAVAGRYLRSDLKIQAAIEDASAANSFAVDIAGYYQSEEIAYSDFNGRWRAGFNISNIGPKLKYDDLGQENFLPTNFAIGGGFDFILDGYNTIGLNLEMNKLLVPTPSDSNGDGVINREDDWYNESWFSALFSSWGDAPDGFSEEFQEMTWAFGAEYWYQNVFAFRTGYFYENPNKGSRQFLSLGAGFRYTTINFDISYLFSTSAVRSPLEGTLRFGLTFSFGEEYSEY